MREIASWLCGILSGSFGRNTLAILLALSLTPYCGPIKAAAPLSVHVQGNQLVDGNGNPLRLLGVNRSGAEYDCVYGYGIFDGPVDSTAITAIKAWHVNAVRVPLNEDCWLGINLPSNPYVGVAYQNAIVAFVQALNDAGIYVILDLHWNAPGTNVANQQQPMADLDHAPSFWTSVASRFRNFPAVIFDLYNEPDVTDWSCWLNGCTVSNYAGTWPTAGMAELVNVVRATGATQPIMLGGLSNASDLSQWLAYVPSDPIQPPQLVASVQSYCGSYNDTTVAECQAALSSNQSSQWPTISAVAKSVPVVTSELGEFDCATTYVTPYMTFADSVGLSYLGWAWDTYGCDAFPALVSDYTGTPTNYGIALKSHLAALNRIHDTHDFNGDGYSDITWRDPSGNTAIWLMQGATVLSSGGIGVVPTTWAVVGQRDFNGDGMADLLWRDTSGDTSVWFMNGMAVASTASVGNIPANWSVVGVADFNGDGMGDILWQDSSGDLAVWLMDGASVMASAALGNVPTTWSIVGTGDFDGDGAADILWRDNLGNTSIWFMSGTTVASSAAIGNLPTKWSVVGIGDFNGDGMADILWRDTAGDTLIWLMSSASVLSSGSLGNVPVAWSVAQTGDFNGNGYSDIVWRDNVGNTTIWFMNGVTASSSVGIGNIPTLWTLQSANSE
jgi:Cellulase (glycosyl hydrolase family 5)/FG-GAP-like repeat